MTTLLAAAEAAARCLNRAAALHPDHGPKLIVAVRATDLVVLLAHAARPTAPTAPRTPVEPAVHPVALIPRQEAPR